MQHARFSEPVDLDNIPVLKVLKKSGLALTTKREKSGRAYCPSVVKFSEPSPLSAVHPVDDRASGVASAASRAAENACARPDEYR
jgi:hypothetical protein